MNAPSAESDILVPISALEHFSYCPRQCALIHVEQTFDENVFTVRGHLAHERVDSGVITTPRGIRQLRAVPLWSDEYRLIGKADVVEFYPDGPVPVEYKVGRITGGHAEPPAMCPSALFGGDARCVGPRRSPVFARYKAPGLR